MDRSFHDYWSWRSICLIIRNRVFEGIKALLLISVSYLVKAYHIPSFIPFRELLGHLKGLLLNFLVSRTGMGLKPWTFSMLDRRDVFQRPRIDLQSNWALGLLLSLCLRATTYVLNFNCRRNLQVHPFAQFSSMRRTVYREGLIFFHCVELRHTIPFPFLFWFIMNSFEFLINMSLKSNYFGTLLGLR